MRFAALFSLSLLLVTGLPARADDREDCRVLSGDPSIEACNRVINSGRFSGRDLMNGYLNRGQEYYLKKDYDRAISDASQAIRIDAKAAVLAWGNRANARSMKGESDAAIADYTQAIRYDPKFTAAYTGRGMERQKKGDTKGALADYKAALAVPVKYQDGKWAHDKARERIEELEKK